MKKKNGLDALVIAWQQDQGNDDLMSQIIEGMRRQIVHYRYWFQKIEWDEVESRLMETVWMTERTYDPSKNFRYAAYCQRALHNAAVTFLKHIQDRKNTFEREHWSLDVTVSEDDHSSMQALSDITPDPHAEIEEERERIAELIQRAHELLVDASFLTKGQRSAVTLVLCGMSYREAAKIMKCTVRSVDNFLHSARIKFSCGKCKTGRVAMSPNYANRIYQAKYWRNVLKPKRAAERPID